MEIKKELAHRAAEIFGGTPRVGRYRDDKGEKCIDILSCKDRPYRGVAAYSTIGLSDNDIGLFADGKSLRIELLGACDEKSDSFPNIIATTAFEIMEYGRCEYGYIIKNVVSEYVSESDMKHVYLANPFLWNEFVTLNFADRKVAWLLLIPISENEKEYAVRHGSEELEILFEKEDIDIFNLRRESVI